jgi:hypothetical protein
MDAIPSAFDFDYEFDPGWSPPGSPIRPWFFMEDPGFEPSDDYWVYALRYRPEKIEFVRRQLQGVDRPSALRAIMRRVWAGAGSDSERYERLIFFVERMMIHPMFEQPLEADAVQSLRHDCSALTDHAEPYPEDLDIAWAKQPLAEARSYGRHIGVWCSRVGQQMTGDWGLGGLVHDALELLMLHEGRCGHQAMVIVQLAQAGGMRARLVQGRSHRYSELMIDGRWVLADTDMFAKGFIPVTPEGELPSIEWMRDHPQIVNTWPTLDEHPLGAARYYGAADAPAPQVGAVS